MCLDPRPDRLFHTSRPARRVSSRRTARDTAPFAGTARPVPHASAYWALETLAGDDELVARGWVVLSRDAHA